MIEAKFFETYGPLKEFYVTDNVKYPSSLIYPPINMLCDKCSMERTFNMDLGPSTILGPTLNKSNVYRIIYKCTACKEFTILFIIYINFINNSFMKIAQWPLWLPKVESDLQKSLGKNLGNYKRGLYCEQEGYGIGAFAYYRRIVEDMIDGLLDDLYDMFSDEEKEKHKENMQRAKGEHVTEKKIEIVKDILPPHLRPGGINPLARLHSSLSEGLHNKPEEDCLKIAMDIRSSLEYLLHDLASRKERNKNYIASMRRLEKQTSPKTIPKETAPKNLK